jgi:hypothetical protein
MLGTSVGKQREKVETKFNSWGQLIQRPIERKDLKKR